MHSKAREEIETAFAVCAYSNIDWLLFETGKGDCIAAAADRSMRLVCKDQEVNRESVEIASDFHFDHFTRSTFNLLLYIARTSILNFDVIESAGYALRAAVNMKEHSVVARIFPVVSERFRLSRRLIDQDYNLAKAFLEMSIGLMLPNDGVINVLFEDRETPLLRVFGPASIIEEMGKEDEACVALLNVIDQQMRGVSQDYCIMERSMLLFDLSAKRIFMDINTMVGGEGNHPEIKMEREFFLDSLEGVMSLKSGMPPKRNCKAIG